MNKIKIKFNILDNFKNILSYNEKNEIEKLIPCSDGYKIEVTFNGGGDVIIDGDLKKYYDLFYKEVLWDFGDGTSVKGINATHFYKKPGKYKITCTLFNNNREGIENSFTLTCHAKEILPTKLSFVNRNNDNIYDISNTDKTFKCSKVNKLLSIECLLSSAISNSPNVSYKFNDTNVENYFDIGRNQYKHLERYYIALDESKTPISNISPSWEHIYGAFSYRFKELELDVYSIDPLTQSVPDILILDFEKSSIYEEKYKLQRVNVMSHSDELPKSHSYIGMRALCDLYFKCDSISNPVVYLNYTFDEGEFAYLNTRPLGFSFEIIRNDIKDVKFICSSNSLLNRPMEYDVYDSDFYNSLYKNMTMPFFLMGVIDDYIPKDISFSIIETSGNISKNLSKDSDIDKPYSKYLSLETKNEDILDGNILISVNGETISFKINKKNMRSYDDIPAISSNKININQIELLNVLMPHPMYDDTVNLKDALKAILFGNNFLNEHVDKTTNFVDKYENIDKMYIDRLITHLRSMGIEMDDYTDSSFEVIPSLREIMRLLSMNHSRLCGNKSTIYYDITIKHGKFGKNIGDRLFIDDFLYIDDKGLVYKIKRGDEIYELEYPTKIISHEKLSNNTNLHDLTLLKDSDCSYYEDDGDTLFCIKNYDKSLGWNLVLNMEQDNMESFYDFFLFNDKGLDVVKNNYLIDENIVDIITDSDTWDSEYGTIFSILLKEIKNNLKI